MPAERGFTLIEILVVVVIIGTTLGFAMLAFGDFGASRKATVTAEQFSSYIKLVQQRAILEANAFAINLNKEGYETLRFNQNSWQSMPNKGIFHWRSFPPTIVVALHRTRRQIKKPEIIISSSGDMTEFRIDFGTSSQADIATLVGTEDGQLAIQHPKSP